MSLQSVGLKKSSSFLGWKEDHGYCIRDASKIPSVVPEAKPENKCHPPVRVQGIVPPWTAQDSPAALLLVPRGEFTCQSEWTQASSSGSYVILSPPHVTYLPALSRVSSMVILLMAGIFKNNNENLIFLLSWSITSGDTWKFSKNFYVHPFQSCN